MSFFAAQSARSCFWIAAAIRSGNSSGVQANPDWNAAPFHDGVGFLDVGSDGPYVVTGTRVQVIEVEGRRVVVKQV